MNQKNSDLEKENKFNIDSKRAKKTKKGYLRMVFKR